MKKSIGCLSPLTVIIFLAFFFAKITGYLDWSWWWIFSPLWIPSAIIITICIIVALLYLSAIIIGLIWTH